MDYSAKTPKYLLVWGYFAHLAEKFNAFCRQKQRADWMSLLAILADGSAPYLGGGFGHFYAYAPHNMEYPINRFVETKASLTF